MSQEPRAKAEVRMDAETSSNYRAGQVPDLPSLCHSIFEGFPLPIATVAGTKHIVSYVNPAFCRLAGKNKNQLIGSTFTAIAPEDGCLSLLDRVYRTGEPHTYTERDYSDAQRAYWAYVMWPVLSANEHPSGVLILVTETAHFHQQAAAMNQELLLSAVRQHELTEVAERLNAQLQLEILERKRMEQALLNSEKLAVTARLAATIAHEINNPLAAITNLIFLLAPLQTSPEARSYIATLEDSVKGLSRIAAQMLKFHRDNSLLTYCSMRLRPHPAAGRSVFIFILLLHGFVKFITVVGTAFLLPIRVAVLTPNTGRESLRLFSPLKVTREPGWGCGCARAL